MIDIFILMAGLATRWNNYQGVAKHFAPVHTFGPTIKRTIALLNQYAPTQVNIKGVVKDTNDDLYKTLGIELVEANLNPQWGDADKFISSEQYWNSNNVTIFIWGDVFLTDKAVKTIYDEAINPKDSWWIVSRFDGNPFTGSVGGENFAHIVQPDGIEHYRNSVYRTAELYKSGVISRSGGWEVYKALKGLPDEEILVWWDKPGGSCKNPKLGNFTEIIDGSEDFDSPKDWDDWHWNFYHSSYETKYFMITGEK